MKKIFLFILTAACLLTLLPPVRAAEQDPNYDNILEVTGTAVEELQTKLDALPDGAAAGDVLITIAQGLSSRQEKLDISVPTNKGITSLTLRHEDETPISITTAGTDLNFFANGIPLIIDKGVNFGKFPTVYQSVDVRVFGGSKNADLTGDTSITIKEGGAITGSIYGGGYNGSVNGDTTIIAHGAYGGINGGGLARLDRDSLTSITADVSGKATIVADTAVVPTYEGMYKTHLYLNGSISGGGYISAPSWSGAPNVPSDCILSAQVKGGVSITVDCQVSSAIINGGGWITATRSVDEGATYNADVTGNVDITLGGKFRQAADYATDRWICTVMGSGYAGYTKAEANISAQVDGDVNITAVQNDEAADANIESGIGTILGGGYVLGNAKHNVSVDGNVTITTSRKAPLIRVGSNEGRLGIIGGGYATGGVANVTKDVTIRICKAPGQVDGYVNMKHVVGGGTAGQNGMAQVGGNIDIEIDDDISFQGGWYQAIRDYIKLGITGGGWVNGKGGNADVSGTVNISIGKGAAFICSTDDYPTGCRIIGGGSIDETYKPQKDESGNLTEPAPSARTGNITVTLNGTTNALEELFCTSLEGYTPSASATVTLNDSHVGWMYDKDITNAVDGNQTVTLNLRGTSQLDYAEFSGQDCPKLYNIEVGNGRTPTEAVIGDYYIKASYGNQPSLCRMNVHVSNNAVMKKPAGVMLKNPYNITIDRGGTLSISEDEEMYGSLTGGGTIAITAANKRLRMLQEGAEFTGTIKVKVTSPEVNQVIATTIQAGTKGTFVYDGDDFVIKKRPDADGNFDWYLAAPTMYLLTATAGQGGSINPSSQISVQEGSSKTFIITPDTGYVVADVLVDGKSVGAVTTYTFELIAQDHTIEASFQKESGYTSCPKDDTCPIHPFTDASTTAWYHDGVHYCIENGLMNGYGNGKFGPDKTLSRGMLAQILYNQAGRPAVSGNSPFIDVAASAWYAEAVTWTAKHGVVEGYGNGKYGPEDPVTREQLAAMFWRYAGRPDASETLSDFKDANQVSNWAKGAICWAVEQGILNGKGGGILNPGSNAARAEAAAIIQRFCEKIK